MHPFPQPLGVVAAPFSPKVVVYSCYFGQYEPFNAKATGPGDGYDRVVLSDQAIVSAGIRFTALPDSDGTATTRSRLAKICPHQFFPEYDWAIYIDNSASLLIHPFDIISEIVAAQGEAAPAGRYLFPHRRRTCSYREARLCMKKGRIPRADFRRQTRHYLDAGFPKDHGLYVNTMMVQKMGDPATDAFNDAWYQHFTEFSQRDQISLPFMLWQENYPVRLMPQTLSDLAQWPMFKKFRRVQFQSAQRARAAKRLAPA